MRIVSLGHVAVVLFAIITAVCQLPAGGSGAPQAWGQCAANELAKLTASDAAEQNHFGKSVSIAGNVTVLGAFRDDDGGFWSGSAYVFRFDGTNWKEEAKLTASDPAVFDQFGRAVSISGDLAVIGAFGDDDACPDDPLCNSGSAYVYRFDGTNWKEEAKLTAPDAAESDFFGWSVSISGDVVLIGAHHHDDTATNSGSVYVYRFDGRSWIEEAKLTASDAAREDQFGWSVSISGDAAVIGALNEGNSGGPVPFDGPGAAYVYRFDGTQWVQEQKLLASDGARDDRFSESVSISGETVVIGATGDDDGGSRSGSAYVYRFDGINWKEEAKLTASDAFAEDRFGHSVSVSGQVVVIGTPQFFNGGPGSAYVYRFDGTIWSEEAKLTASDAAAEDVFGISVSASGDTAVIGAAWDDDAGSTSGSAYVFRGLTDCNDNGTLDLCDIADNTSRDANGSGIPDECECLWDLDGNGSVGRPDLISLITQWGTDPGGPPDFDGDRVVAVPDLLVLLAAWGACQ